MARQPWHFGHTLAFLVVYCLLVVLAVSAIVGLFLYFGGEPKEVPVHSDTKAQYDAINASQ